MIDPVSSIALTAPSGPSGIGSAGQAASPLTAGAKAETSGIGSFADLIADYSNTVSSKLNTSENLSVEALRGNAGPREVAEAVMSAEQSLQVAIAVRDKIVSAYLEISRMAI